ncbi:MAG: MerC family mercury resistance protein [Nannocystales bacterium]
MPTVDFVYDKDCPNVEATRGNLVLAFSQVGISTRWKEHQIGSAASPQRVRGFGSPTILVDGVDVGGLTAGGEDCCRVYPSGGAPSVEVIAEALGRAGQGGVGSEERPPTPSRSRWRSTAAVLPGIGIALVPKVVCPLCWPAYAGVLGAAGLTVLMEARWLLPISAVFLLTALAALALGARSRRGYGPLCLGASSAVAVLVGKFALDSTVTVYFGIAALIVACIWNAWPRRLTAPSCSTCRPVVPE